jgi:hypothetical protein
MASPFSHEELSVNINHWIRQTHRWLSLIFTATVVANFVAMGFGAPPAWVTYAPLLPLFLLLFSGLYMFVLPYVAGSVRSPAATATERHRAN